MASCGKFTCLTACLSLVLLAAFAAPSNSLPTAGDVERRASYWPGMWNFARNGGGADYGADYDVRDRSSDVGKHHFHLPGIWGYHRYPFGAMAMKRAYFSRDFYNDSRYRYSLARVCSMTGDRYACRMLDIPVFPRPN